jgi:hypothetical protein
MGQFQPLPIVGGCYSDDARPWSVQDTVNYLPIKAEAPGTRSEGKLVCVPGLVPFCGTQAAPVRGAHNCEGRFFVVAGTTLYQISTLGARTTLGTVPGDGRVCFDHNQITGGNEVVVVNGSQGFVYNTKTAVFAQITDQDFPGSAIIRYLGQYLLGIKPDRTGWFTSDLATATTWLSTDTYEAESSPDLLLDIQVSQGRALIMGERTIEEWVNDPTENAAFQRGSVIERGAASAHANVIMDNTLIWLGDDDIVYRLDGYTPRRISTFPIEQAISRCDTSKAFAFAWEDRGHKVYYLTLPDGHTWGYDIASGLWHRRESYRLGRWIANTLTRWNGAWYAGHYDNGIVYLLDWDVMAEGCDELVRSRTLACIHDNENRLTVDAVALTVDVGAEPVLTAHTPPGIAGDLPDGLLGEVVSYQYTLTPSFPGEIVTASITAGALPAGLSMNSSGLITGTRTTAGAASWTVTARGACAGDAVTLDDASVTTDASEGIWWLEYASASGSEDSAWFSEDALSWTRTATRSPYVQPTGGLEFTGTRMLGLGTATVETTADTLSSDGITSTITTPTYVSTANNPLCVSDGVTFTLQQTHYSYSSDGGLTWADAASPGGGTLLGVSKLASGRWLSIVLNGSAGVYGFYYSDQTVPTTWTLASNANASHTPQPNIYSYGTGAFHVDNTGSIRRTTDGTSWDYTVSGYPGTGGIASGATNSAGVWVLGTGTLTHLFRSDDNGVTWTTISMPVGVVTSSLLGIHYGAGAFVASFDTYVFVSTDAGLTWTKSTLPLTETINRPFTALFLGMTLTAASDGAASVVYLVDESDSPLTDESGNYITG